MDRLLKKGRPLGIGEAKGYQKVDLEVGRSDGRRLVDAGDGSAVRQSGLWNTMTLFKVLRLESGIYRRGWMVRLSHLRLQR